MNKLKDNNKEKILEEEEIIINESDILKDELLINLDKEKKIDMENPKDFIRAEIETGILYENLKKKNWSLIFIYIRNGI